MHAKNQERFNYIHTTKFKNITFSIRFRNTLEKKAAAKRSLLALMLCDRCKKYATKQQMGSKIDELYGVMLNAQTTGFGLSHVLEIRLTCIHPQFIPDAKNYLSEVINFLKEVLFNPLLNEQTFIENQNILQAKIERNEDEASNYAISQGLKLAGADSALGISTLGELDDIKNIVLEDIRDTYEELMHRNEISVLVCGEVDDECKRELEKQLVFHTIPTSLESFYYVNNSLKPMYKEEFRNISQTYIMMVYFTHVNIHDDDFNALRVGNAMLGQYSTSLLFKEVREKHSLCYSIYSNLIAYDGALSITTGVEKKNIKKTIKLIKQQMILLNQAKYDDELLKTSKQMIINSIIAGKDHRGSLIALQYQNMLLNSGDQCEDIIERIDAVKREDVTRVMKQCDLKTEFILTNGGESVEDC